MAKNVEFKVSIMSFDKGAAMRLKAARSEVSKIEEQILQSYRKSERFQAVCDLAGTSDYGSKNSPMIRLQGDNIVASVYADFPDEEKANAVRPTLYLGEKTINLLLSGKLLTDDEKKELIKQIGFDTDSLKTA